MATVPESTFRAFCAALSQPIFDKRLTIDQLTRIAAAGEQRLATSSRRTAETIGGSAAIYLLSRTATAANSDLLRATLEESNRSDLRNACLLALAHTRDLSPEEDLRPYLREDDLRWTTSYAAGITGHPQLTAPEAESPDARWWLSVGPGFWE